MNFWRKALLKAWEQGRLHELIDGISQKQNLQASELLELLAEADVLTALNIAEVVKTKLEAVRGLKRLVTRRRLENKLRDYLAERPYLLMPGWETFAKETRVRKHVWWMLPNWPALKTNNMPAD